MPYSRPGVYVTEGPFSTTTTPGIVGTPTVFVGTAERGPITPTRVDSWIAYKSLFGDLNDAYDLGYAVYHFFANGGRTAFISRVYDESNTIGASTSTAAFAGSTAGASTPTLFNLSAKNPGSWGNSLSATISAGTTGGSTPTFNLSVANNGIEVELWSDVSLSSSSSRYLTTLLENYSNYVKVFSSSVGTGASYSVVTNTVAFVGGSNGTTAASASAWDTYWSNAVNRIDSVENSVIINLVGQSSATRVGAALTYAKGRGDAFVIIDPPANDSSASSSTVVSNATALANSLYSNNGAAFGALYTPMLQMVDPSKSGISAIRNTYPGGAIAGLYSRVEDERSVGKAPAGYAYELRNALGVVTKFTEAQEGTLYDAYVNPLKAVTGAGVIINGARTLYKSDITKYIPVRRSINFVKYNVKELTKFAVFEPNNELLWNTIQMRLSQFLSSFWSAGGLKGRNPSEAFYIICDGTNNTSTTIENGEVRIEVGIALQSPAEFIIINVSQFSSGTATAELL
jgi:hypothetical protein